MRPGFPRLTAEFVAIVVGVLVALAVDALVERRNERRLEEMYLSRLEAELQKDSAVITDGLMLVGRGDSALADLALLRSREIEPADTLRLIDGLMRARVRGLPGAMSQVTFDELRSTGLIRLIRDPELRARMGSHYARIARSRDLLDADYSHYPLAISEVLPAEAQRLWIAPAEVTPAVLARAIGQLEAAPDLERHIRSKRGYLVLQQYNLERALISGDSLLRQLRRAR